MYGISDRIRSDQIVSGRVSQVASGHLQFLFVFWRCHRKVWLLHAVTGLTSPVNSDLLILEFYIAGRAWGFVLKLIRVCDLGDSSV